MGLKYRRLGLLLGAAALIALAVSTIMLQRRCRRLGRENAKLASQCKGLERDNAKLKNAKSDGYQAGLLRGTELARSSIDPLSETPFFIFEKPQVLWATLAPHLEVAFPAGMKIEKRVVATFPIPGNYDGSDISKVVFDAEQLSFPGPGEYYLRTTVGCFKILILDPAASQDDRILAMARFVARNIVHSKADAGEIQPHYNYYPYHRPDRLLKKFFATDQPLKLHCGHAAEFLNYILSREGIQVHRIHLHNSEKPPKGHLVSEAFFPGLAKWGMLDPDYGAFAVDKNGRILSIKEVAELTRADLSGVTSVDMAGKCRLKGDYNTVPYCPDFSWTPDKSATRMVENDAYRKVLRDYTHEYGILEYDRFFQWCKADRFTWDGKPVREEAKEP